MPKYLLFLLSTLLFTVSAFGGAQQPVTLEFRAVVGDAPLACGRLYPGVGAGDTTIEFSIQSISKASRASRAVRTASRAV